MTENESDIVLKALSQIEDVKSGLEPLFYDIIMDGVHPRILGGALALMSFDLLLDEAEDQAETRTVFLELCDAMSRHRLDTLLVPNPDEE